jgi:hypothetical protein
MGLSIFSEMTVVDGRRPFEKARIRYGRISLTCLSTTIRSEHTEMEIRMKSENESKSQQNTNTNANSDFNDFHSQVAKDSAYIKFKDRDVKILQFENKPPIREISKKFSNVNWTFIDVMEPAIGLACIYQRAL